MNSIKVAEVEAKFDGKKVETKLAKDWWWLNFWTNTSEYPGVPQAPADPEYKKFGKALGASPETVILCISPNNFSWPPSEGFSPGEIIEFSRQNPFTLVSVCGEEIETVWLAGRQIGSITSCRSDVFWDANGKSGRNY